MTVKITVVIPAGNVGSNIVRALKAIQKGTHQPDEILVVGGWSTEKTSE